VDAGTRNKLCDHPAARRVSSLAPPGASFDTRTAVDGLLANQLTGRRPSAICSRRVDRAYTSASGVSEAGLAALRGSVLADAQHHARRRDRFARRARSRSSQFRAGYAGRPALTASTRCGSVFSFGDRHLPRLGFSARCDGGRSHAAVSGGIGRLRRWGSLGSRAELPVGVHSERRTARRLKVCLGCRGTRGGEWGLQLDPTVPNVFRPRSRGGRSERPFWVGRGKRHADPGRTAPKTGRSNTSRSGGRPGIARDALTDGVAEMTRSSWRSAEPSKLSISSDRLRSDSRVVLELRRFPRAGRSSFSAAGLPPTDSRAALSLGHAQHVGHQCRYR